MAEDLDQELGFDYDPSGINAMNAGLEEMGTELHSVMAALLASNTALESTSIKIQKVLEDGTKLNATIRQSTDENGKFVEGYNAVVNTINLANESQTKAVETLSAMLQARRLDAQEAVIQAEAQERLNTQNALAEQVSSVASNSDEINTLSRIIELEGERARIGRERFAQEQAQAELAQRVTEVASDSQEITDVSILIERTTERLAQEREINTEIERRRQLMREQEQDLRDYEALNRQLNEQEAVATLQPHANNLIAQNPNAEHASIAEVQRVSAEIGRLHTIIADGLVSAERAAEIIASVEARSGEVFVGAEQRVAQHAVALHRNVQNLGQEFERANQGAQEVTLTWQTMVRILETQIIHQVFYQVVGDLKAAVGEAAAFETRISEIRTISQSNQLSFESWAAGVEKLSNQFGNSQADVAEGAYQALSNQVATGADTFGFLSKALAFSQVTMSSVRDSVNLLSSALNSFHLEVTETDRVSAVFFNTLTQGRLRAEDLANIFGRSGGIAHALGLSLEETGAAISTLTVSGVPANEAMTLLNNVLTHLLNPTSEMKKLLAEWGVPTGEAAIATFGFAGVLGKLQQETKGSSGELAELFKDIRGIRGALDFTNEGLTTYQKNLAEIRDTTKFDIAEKISLESAGKQFEIQGNQIKNYFMNDFGKSILETVESLTTSEDQFGNKTSHLVDDIKQLAAILIAGLTGWGAYRSAVLLAGLATGGCATETAELTAAITANTAVLQGETIAAGEAAVATEALGISLGFATAGLSILAAGLAYLWFSSVETSKQVEADIASLAADGSAAAIQMTKIIDDAARAELLSRTNSIEEYEKALLDSDRSINLEISSQASKLEAIYSNLSEAIKNHFKNIVSDLESSISSMKHAAEEAKSIADAAAAKIQEGQDDLGKRAFDTSTGLLPSGEQLDAKLAEVARLSALSTARITDAPNKADGSADVDQMKRNQAEGLKAEAEAEQLLNEVTRSVADAEKRRDELSRQIATEKIRITEKQVTDQQRALIDQTRTLELELQAAQAKGNHVQEAQLRLQLDAQRSKLAADTQANEQANMERHLSELQDELAKSDDILARAAKYNDLAKISADLVKQRTDALQKERDLVLEIQKAEDAKAKTAEENLNKLKQEVELIEKVKAPNEKQFEDIKTTGDVDKFIDKNFTDHIRQINGIASPELLQQLWQQAETMRDRLNTQLQGKLQRERDEAITQAANDAKKALENQEKLREDAEHKEASIRSQIGKILTGTTDMVPKRNDETGEQDFSGSELTKAGGYGGFSPEVAQRLLSEISDPRKLSNDIETNYSQGGKDDQVGALLHKLEELATQLPQATKQKDDANAATAALEASIQKSGVPQLLNLLAPKVQDNTKALQDSLNEMKDLSIKSDALRKALEDQRNKYAPIGGNPISFNPQYPSLGSRGTGGTTDASVNTSNQVTLTINTTQPVDAKYLERVLPGVLNNISRSGSQYARYDTPFSGSDA